MRYLALLIGLFFTMPTFSQSDSTASSDDTLEWQTSFSGMKYAIIKKGTGKEAYANRRVTVHYKGWLEDGTVFDSSGASGFSFNLGRGEVIRGWDEGVRMMSEGAKYRFVIPPKMAYGRRGVPGIIPPNATLIFEVELITVENI